MSDVSETLNKNNICEAWLADNDSEYENLRIDFTDAFNLPQFDENNLYLLKDNVNDFIEIFIKNIDKAIVCINNAIVMQ